MKYTHIIESRQTLLDVAIVRLGCAHAALLLALENEISVSEIPRAGSTIAFSNIKNNELANYLQERNEIPATGDTGLLGGINYMEVETDFKIS